MSDNLNNLKKDMWISHGILPYQDDRIIGLYYQSRIMGLMKRLGVYNI
jgi:hypothetical protein